MTNRSEIFRRRTHSDGSRAPIRFTAQVMNDVRSEQQALAVAMLAEGLGAPPQGWKPPEMPAYAWMEYCLEATGHLTRALRLLAGSPEAAERERLAMLTAEGFGGSMGTSVGPALSVQS